MPDPQKPSAKPGRTRRFKRASSLLDGKMRTVGEARGFAVSRLLTHWPDVVGERTAAIARPVRVSYGRGGLGATLTLLTTGANAPLVQADEARIRERVNACYGYAAIARIRVTQTAPMGFSEGQAVFETAPRKPKEPRVDASAVVEATDAAQSVSNEDLRKALASLGTHVLSRSR